MVDFPEGYGFEPGGKAKLMQESFKVDIGVFTRRGDEWDVRSRRRSPYTFNSFGFIRKENSEAPLRGTMFMSGVMEVGTPIEGTLQQVVTALCTLHRMRGHMK